jgi:hypothetical protein
MDNFTCRVFDALFWLEKVVTSAKNVASQKLQSHRVISLVALQVAQISVSDSMDYITRD